MNILFLSYIMDAYYVKLRYYKMHTHTYIYIYIYRERERERERERAFRVRLVKEVEKWEDRK